MTNFRLCRYCFSHSLFTRVYSMCLSVGVGICVHILKTCFVCVFCWGIFRGGSRFKINLIQKKKILDLGQNSNQILYMSYTLVSKKKTFSKSNWYCNGNFVRKMIKLHCCQRRMFQYVYWYTLHKYNYPKNTCSFLGLLCTKMSKIVIATIRNNGRVCGVLVNVRTLTSE